MQKTRCGLVVVAASMLLACAGMPAYAMPDFMPIGGPASQPVGHYEFCKREPQECRQTAPQRAPVKLTRNVWTAMVKINNLVNGSVIPRTDMEMWGVAEYWSFPDLYGDCEDYVLEKRRLLMEKGIPADSLLVTVVRQRDGSGHAVLTVSTDMGDFILDNMEPRILHWSETSYLYLKRQSRLNASRWVSIEDGRDVAVGAIARSH